MDDGTPYGLDEGGYLYRLPVFSVGIATGIKNLFSSSLDLDGFFESESFVEGMADPWYCGEVVYATLGLCKCGRL